MFRARQSKGRTSSSLLQRDMQNTNTKLSKLEETTKDLKLKINQIELTLDRHFLNSMNSSKAILKELSDIKKVLYFNTRNNSYISTQAIPSKRRRMFM